MIKKDPAANSHFQACIINLGGMLGSRDYAVYQGDKVPADKMDKENEMWIWLNKSDNPEKPGTGVIDLENFHRPPEEPLGKGGVIWSARIVERPRYEMERYVQGNYKWPQPYVANPKFNMTISTDGIFIRTNRFMGTGQFANGYDSDGDEQYFTHPAFGTRRQYENRRGNPYDDNHVMQQHVGWKEKHPVGPTVITKFKLETQAVITPGDAANGREGTYILEVFAKGTAITTWEETVELRDRETPGDEGMNAPRQKYVERRVEGSDQKFVDRIELTLKKSNQIVHQWVIIGDSNHARFSSQQLQDNTPLYDISVNGGFFERSSSVITTKESSGVDGALCMVIAHLVATEYSIGEIKKDLDLKTSNKVPLCENDIYRGF